MSIININELDVFLAKHKINNHKDEISSLLELSINKILKDKLKELKNKNRIVINDNAKEHAPAKNIFNDKEILTFPSCVQADISNATVIGKSLNVIQLSNGKKYHIKNRLNDLSGGEWTFFLNSVINTRYSIHGEEGFAHHIRKIHPSPKPPQLMKEIIEFFTKENEIVFDYFMGVGGSLLGASLANRRAIGIDLDSKYIQAYKEANCYLKLKEQITIQSDSIRFLQSNTDLDNYLDGEKISLILIDPPYGDMLSRSKTGEAAKKGKDTSPTPFTSLKEDLGNMPLDKFLIVFSQSVVNSLPHLKDKGHIVVFIKDMQPNDKALNLLHADIIMELNKICGIQYLGTKIWADQGVNLYPYGYPYSFVSNQIHQYIMIFKKQ